MNLTGAPRRVLAPLLHKCIHRNLAPPMHRTLNDIPRNGQMTSDNLVGSNWRGSLALPRGLRTEKFQDGLMRGLSLIGYENVARSWNHYQFRSRNARRDHLGVFCGDQP